MIHSMQRDDLMENGYEKVITSALCLKRINSSSIQFNSSKSEKKLKIFSSFFEIFASVESNGVDDV